MVRRYAAGTAAGAAVLVSLTGCMGSGSGKSDAVNVSAAQAIGLASQKTASVSSYKVDISVNGTGKASGTAHGVLQVRLKPQLAAVGDLRQADFGGHSIPVGERAILLGDTLYAKVPSQLSQFTGGKPWVKFSISKATQQAGVNMNQVLQQADPAQQTKIFTGSKDVHRVGTQSVNGTQTTHYQGTLTPQEAAAKLDPQARTSYQHMYQQAGAKDVTFDLWVGSDNLPRKLVAKFTTAQGAATATMIYSNYNKSVTVSAPPAAQVADGQQLAGSMTHGATPGTKH